LAAGLLLLAPSIPLIFMGQEYDETHPFPYFCAFEDPQLAVAARRGRQQEFSWDGNDQVIPDPQARATFESAKLQWSWQGARQAGLRNLYRRLLALRQRRLPLAKSSDHPASLVEGGDGPAMLLRLERTISSSDGDSRVVAFFNLDSRPRQVLDGAGLDASLLLQSEEGQFGGARRDDDAQDMLLPFEFCVFGPSRWSER
jgi:maltooligosyltrehalose trehalohydrolase